MARGKNPSTRVDLTRTLELLTSLITKSLCQATFQKVRTNERERKWSLEALIQFFVAIVLRAPESLTAALAEIRDGRMSWALPVKATDQAFFEKSKNLSWKFFAEVFRGFLLGLTKVAKPIYRPDLHGLQEKFTDVLIIDGSRLASIAHKLKILWNERAVVLPGCLIGVYDLFRGIPYLIDFCADAAASESKRAMVALAKIKRGTLIVGDRLYCTAQFFENLKKKGLYGVSRRNKCLGLRRIEAKPFRKKRYKGGLLTDHRVEAGSGQTAPIQQLRLIRFKRGRTVHELLTNVQDTEQLSAEEAMELYPARWTVERMFYDLKVVLNLNRIYAANPNAVGMQVYAAVMVYAALRVAQGEVAQQAGLEPEEISTAKFFPKMVSACHDYVQFTYGISETIRLNPGVQLKTPRLKGRRFTTVDVDTVRLSPREGRRRKRRYCKSRKKWKSFNHVSGGKKLTW